MKYKEYLAIAIPFIISTITQPLLGAVDTAVIGRLGNSSYIGGVAIGTVIFNTMYWLFGFLRVSTSGFSAQSLGSNSEKDTYFAYFRPALIGILISTVFIILQKPILMGALAIYKPENVVLEGAVSYFSILIWGAPFVLLGYVNLGWIMGRKLIKETLFLQISANVINIVLDLLFVTKFNLGVKGVAYATLIAQAYSFVLGYLIISKKIDFSKVSKFKNELVSKKEFKKIMGVNLDLMIRTICLLTMTNMFVARGNRFGADILAANAVLFQIQYIMSYLFDGFANASSIFAGKAFGAKNFEEYRLTIKFTYISILVTGLALSVAMILFRIPIIAIFTDLASVIKIAEIYSIWLIIFPLIIGIGLVYYGIFSGISYTEPVKNSMVMSLGLFLITYFIFVPKFGNHGLWFAFIMFSLGRSVFLYIYKGKMESRFLEGEIV